MDSTYTYSTGSYSSGGGAAAAFLVVMMLFYFIFIIALYVFSAVCLGKIFKKANTPTWQAWVPFLNTWKTLEIGGQPGYWAVLALIPLVNIASLVFHYIALYHIGKKLGKEDAFILLAIFLPIVWLPWLAFDHSTWDESKGAPRLDTPIAPSASMPQNPVPPAA